MFSPFPRNIFEDEESLPLEEPINIVLDKSPIEIFKECEVLATLRIIKDKQGHGYDYLMPRIAIRFHTIL